MSTRSALVLAVLYLWLVGWLPTAAKAQSTQTGRPQRTDRYGDPLPPGVVARLGTDRLTLPDAGCLTFSADGRYLAAHNGVAHNGPHCVRVWDVTSGKELFQLTTPTFGPYELGRSPLAFSPDGKAIALASEPSRMPNGYEDGRVRVLEVATGKELHCFGGLEGAAMHLVFSPDGRYLFGGGLRVSLVRWDLARGGARKEYTSFRPVYSLAFSRDGKMLTAATAAPQPGRSLTFVRLEAATGKEVGRHSYTLATKGAGAVSPEGSLFAVTEADGKSIALFDVLTGREVSRARGTDCPAFISFSADGAAMTCSSREGALRVWDTATGKLRTHFKAPPGTASWVALSPDGKRLAHAGLADDAIHVWDVAAGRELHSFAGHRGGPLTVAFLPGGEEIATAGRDSIYSRRGNANDLLDWSLRRWDAATGAERAVTSRGFHSQVTGAVFSADGRRLATVIRHGTVHLWDVETGKEIRRWKVPLKESRTTMTDGEGHQTILKSYYPELSAPVFSPDGKVLLGTDGTKIRRYEVATGRELPSFSTEGEGRIWWYLPTPDGQTLAVGCWGRPGVIVVLDAASGKARRRMEGIKQLMVHAALSPDGRTIAVDQGKEVWLWEMASGRSRGHMEGVFPMFSLAFSPDGRYLAVGIPSSAVDLLDLASGHVAGHLQNDRGLGEQIVFSPDGSRLAITGYYPTAVVADVAELCRTKHGEPSGKAVAPTAEEVEGLWAELSGADGARAYRAIRRLGLSGPRGAVFLQSRLKEDKPPDERRIARLIAELGDDEFAIRDRASAQLRKLGIQAEPALRRALAGEVSAEAHRRIKSLLARLGDLGPLPSPELVRLRAVEALEANAGSEARQALTELAKGSADALVTREAKASLERLSRRPAPGP